MLKYLGYSHYSVPGFAYWFKPATLPRNSNHPIIFTSTPSFTPRKLEISTKPHETLPIVFIHGIGGGLSFYLNFLYILTTSHPRTPIFLLDLPHVSMRFVNSDYVSGWSDSVKSINGMLKRHQSVNDQSVIPKAVN